MSTGPMGTKPAATTPTAEPPDHVLVARARRGEAEALVVLYRRYLAEIFGYVVNQVGNTQDAEDVTSETFARVVDALDGFRAESSFRTWLYAIARNQVRDHWRRNGRQPTVALDPARVASPDPGSGPATPAESRWSQLGTQVMSELPDNYRAVLRLRILEERSVRETAAALNTTEGNVKVLQHRALRRAAAIASSLEAEEEDDR